MHARTGTGPARCHATRLETIWVDVPEDAVPAYEAALSAVCTTIGFFRDEARGLWRVEGVRDAGQGDDLLGGALALAEAASGVACTLQRQETEAEGWLARTRSAFPEQFVGRRFAVRGTHLSGPFVPGRITLILDAGVAFGSGEHGSTRGCLRALERVAQRPGWRGKGGILDLGTGSGILAIAASRLLHRKVLATDIEPWSVRVAAQNAAMNGCEALVRCRLADGWRHRVVRQGRPYGLVFANILARPLCAMARSLANGLAPGGVAILAGLLTSQARMVLAAHRRRGLVLDFALEEGPWTTLVLRRNANGRA